jgi:hypothetical protein
VLDTDGLPYMTDDLAYTDFVASTTGVPTPLSPVTTVSHSHQGHFQINLQPADTNTLGGLRITLNKAGLAMPPWVGDVRPAVWFNVIAGTSGGSLPNAAADAAGGLPTSDAGGLDLDTLLGRLDVGARTIAVTVTDGTDPLEGAIVRFTKGAESTTLAVSADASVTYEMTATSFAPSPPGLVTGYLCCYDEQGQIEPGVTIRLRQTAAVSGTGVGYDSASRTAVSDATGLVQFAGLFPGAKYQIRRETGSWYDSTIDAGATDPYALPSILGG